MTIGDTPSDTSADIVKKMVEYQYDRERELSKQNAELTKNNSDLMSEVARLSTELKQYKKSKSRTIIISSISIIFIGIGTSMFELSDINYISVLFILAGTVFYIAAATI